MLSAVETIEDRVQLDIQDGVADVRLCRPNKMNALDFYMFGALDEAARRLVGREDVRAVVLSGEGPCFSAGLDLTQAPDLGTPAGREGISRRSHGDANLYQRAALAWRDLDVPVVAALHGAVLGGGLQIALGPDIRYCAPDAKLSFMEVSRGLVPDMGAFLLMRNLVRDDRARELIYSARTVNGLEALELGLVTRVCPDPRAEALSLARVLASQSRSAIAAAKRLLNSAAHADRATILLAESNAQLDLLQTKAFLDGVGVAAADHARTTNRAPH